MYEENQRNDSHGKEWRIRQMGEGGSKEWRENILL